MFQNDDFIEVYAKSTGEKQIIPRVWLDNEVLAKDFEVAPSARASEEPTSPRRSRSNRTPAGDAAPSDSSDQPGSDENNPAPGQ